MYTVARCPSSDKNADISHEPSTSPTRRSRKFHRETAERTDSRSDRSLHQAGRTRTAAGRSTRRGRHLGGPNRLAHPTRNQGCLEQGLKVPNRILIDTDILIDYLRGRSTAIGFVSESADHIILSAISVAELYAGVRCGVDDPEHRALANFLGQFPIIPISPDIAKVGGLYRRDYWRSHGVGLADAVIAATAVSSEAELKTLNVKHYPMFDNLEPPYRR